MDTNIELTENIRKAITESGLSDSTVADKTGIPYTTLARRLKGAGGWTTTEVLKVAQVIRVTPSKLLPASFFSKAVA